MSEVLHVKYRPKKFSEVVGHDSVVKALRSVLSERSSSCFLFCGPSGCGKTTLARLVAKRFGCVPEHILEIDAATHTGVDSMRMLQEGLRYKPFGESSGKAIIIDECHQLSKAAWNSLLKVLEEPPAHVVWVLCTTELGKVPQTIRTRCSLFTLTAVDEKCLRNLLSTVIDKEGLSVSKEVVDVVIKEAGGSPRQALVNLALCQGASKAEAATILRSAAQSEPVLDLCRFLAKPGGSWRKAVSIISRLSSENPESVRIIVCNYMAAALLKATTDRDAVRFLSVLEAFSTPYHPSEKLAPLLLSVGGLLFAD